ncbi:hypothetical protein Q5P01_020017 [Channa striata]|uniref:Uncharacterized protein n=1 Tax=Channa striata TaxID=64152 RepID=A0AA88S1D7_CHASR|nr:hypothetical protein Q5P01_020017 [Channa striata]
MVSMSPLLLFIIVRLLLVVPISLCNPRRPVYLWDKGNLRICRDGTNYCSSTIEGHGVLLECTADNKGMDKESLRNLCSYFSGSPKVDVVFSEPLWVGDGDTFTVTAKIMIPLGAQDRYRIFAFNWYANGWDKWLLGGDPKLVKSSNESRYSTTLGSGWLKHHEGFVPGGFFVSTHDISLTVKDFSCASFISLSTMAAVFNVSPKYQRAERHVDSL